VAVLSPEDLIAQATKLTRPSRAGRPLQVDLRRAISSAYYTIFHLTLTAAADHVVGRVHRDSPNYALVYRNINHRQLRELCEITRRSSLPAKYKDHTPPGGFGPDIQGFASAAVTLQEARHDLARTAMNHWAAAPAEHRTAFLLMLLFPPR
jgi:hypothetical protein